MNSTEQKIREAFEKYINEMFKLYDDDPDMRNAIKREKANGFDMFSKGYIALLNELEPQGEWNTFQNGLDIELRRTTVYTLPEGVEKP